ncbi:NAD-dependent epimerase/dehydratase family protein [Microlunatus soli]|uniref:Nucleoside-diphosphate-sugar epimerase n=1 Tax=Microlunatus soli TaxID=630515 RepID=A0A1H1V0M1_9ACTN|nr:NAD(P)-dependent oxidoreductase [Microlunatus soli]SDS78263.1 Nucleoside-diphosphate-sugar epimerase [Microlunatus soli]
MSHPLDGRSILVTGAEGNIGSAVCRRLSALGAKITGLSLAATDDHESPPMVQALYGDTTDPEVVADALDGIELVVHLAAIPHPIGNPAPKVFGTNVQSTFNVLWQAAERGIGRAVIASSINHTGLPFNSDPTARPSYFPVDEAMPSQLTDPYALSKVVDEVTAGTVHRRTGIDVVALRFPFTVPAEQVARRAESLADDPSGAVVEAWSYLDVRDAALAVEKALVAETTGVVPVYVTADDTLLPYPTEQVLDRYAPGILRTRTFVGREVPIDLTRARTLLGFRAEHPVDVTPRSLD